MRVYMGNVAIVGLAMSNTRPGLQSFLKVEVDKLLEMLTGVDTPVAFPDSGAAYFGGFVANYPANFAQIIINTFRKQC